MAHFSLTRSFGRLLPVYGVLRDTKKSQLQAPNNELVKLLEYILPLLTFTTDEIQAVQWRSHVNKGNIMETIMLALAESGAHLLTWKTAWAMFQHQHKRHQTPVGSNRFSLLTLSTPRGFTE